MTIKKNGKKKKVVPQPLERNDLICIKSFLSLKGKQQRKKIFAHHYLQRL